MSLSLEPVIVPVAIKPSNSKKHSHEIFCRIEVVGGLALVTADNLYIRADPVYKYCFNWVKSDTFLQQTLGDGLKPGSLRSYRLDSGKMEVVGGAAVWRPPRIQV